MFLSASRRTDIPSYYSDWFFNRVRAGFFLVRNPMNYRQVSKINIAPDTVDGIVFWTKNPIPMLDRLHELGDYAYCFQFTITPYGKDVEPNLPSKNGALLPAFKRLSGAVGADRVVWRYDPVLINDTYSAEYHVRAFGEMALELRGYTRKVTISFIDAGYREVRNNIKELALRDFPPDDKIALASRFAEIARGCGMEIAACAEKTDLRQYGVEPARCVDARLFSKLSGCRLDVDKDKTQRPECGCATSIDVGMYNTCRNGCLYCYANYNRKTVDGNYAAHDPGSPLLSGDIGDGDRISERAVKSYRTKELLT